VCVWRGIIKFLCIRSLADRARNLRSSRVTSSVHPETKQQLDSRSCFCFFLFPSLFIYLFSRERKENLPSLSFSLSQPMNHSINYLCAIANRITSPHRSSYFCRAAWNGSVVELISSLLISDYIAVATYVRNFSLIRTFDRDSSGICTGVCIRPFSTDGDRSLIVKSRSWQWTQLRPTLVSIVQTSPNWLRDQIKEMRNETSASAHGDASRYSKF